MLITNVKFPTDNRLHSIYVNREGIIDCIDCNKKDGLVIDAKGRVISHPFVNPHSHLGYALTLKYARYNESGTLIEGVQITREEILPKIDEEDLRKRLNIIAKMMFINGVLYARSHEPVLNDLAMKMLKVREEVSDLVKIQVVAFPTPGYFYEDNTEKTEKTLEEGAEVVGLIPHSEGNVEEGNKSVKLAIELAVKYNKLIDGHVDETDDPFSRFSELLAREASLKGIGSKTSISHMTASHSYDNWYFHKLTLLLKESGVSVISNPVVSMHLQGRYDNYPKRRGIARIRELLKNGVNVALGSDNVVDAIYPLGDYNMLRVVQEAFLVDHFVASEVTSLIQTVTDNAYKALNINKPVIKEGEKAQFIVLQTKSFYDAVRTALPPLLVVNGKYYAHNTLSLSVNGKDVSDELINLVD